MTRLLTALVAGLVLLAAEAPAAPVAPPPREAGHYFPTTVGAKWVYEHTEGGRTREVVEVVTAVHPGPAGTKVVKVGLLLSTDPKPYLIPISTFEVRAGGLARTEERFEFPLPVPSLALKLPHRPGQRWYDTAMQVQKAAHGPERVEVKAGTFDCIRVEYLHSRGRGRTRKWYAHGVGEVKVTSPDEYIELKSFTPGKN